MAMDIVSADAAGIEKALAVLRNGGVVAHATETCYGLACDLRNPSAVDRLFHIKNRPQTQPVSALFKSVEQAKRYVEWNDAAEKLANEHLPGPLTLILYRRNDPPHAIFMMAQETSSMHRTTSQRANQLPATSRTLGVRVSSHPIATDLVRQFGSPISTTSANLHGKSNPYSAEDIRQQFEGRDIVPDLILDSGKLPVKPPSTVVNLASADRPILREGSIRPLPKN
jgi:L-threonylcarbamoyladenylate synthase